MAELDTNADLDQFAETTVTDPELRTLLGMFDVPAFARRGADLEAGIARLHDRCRRERLGMLEMVRLRLRQWSEVAVGPDDWCPPLAGPVGPLWASAGLDGPERWAHEPGTPRRRRAVAVDLLASVERFDRRWAKFLEGLDLDRINGAIESYNRYYLIEKECHLGSARLAARHFAPRPPLSTEALAVSYPPLQRSSFGRGIL